MKYSSADIITKAGKKSSHSLLLIYTGGTMGMVYNELGTLVPFDFNQVLERIPEINSLDLKLTVITLREIIDSSNIKPNHWQDLAEIIATHYKEFDGFVILHGTDTMAYSASALSFMLQGLRKPVIFTGAQIPIGHIRSDARENLITALEIASAMVDDKPRVREVCIYFNFQLLRGNRSQKVRSSTFAAFASQNYPRLAESGIEIEYRDQYFLPLNQNDELQVRSKIDPNVTVFKVFPGLTDSIVRSVFENPELKAIVLESFGSGNVMSDPWFLELIEQAIRRGVIIVNVSQCSGGEVIQGRYETSRRLSEIGVISGRDMTTEAALTKLMYLLANESDRETLIRKLQKPLAGEIDK